MDNGELKLGRLDVAGIRAGVGAEGNWRLLPAGINGSTQQCARHAFQAALRAFWRIEATPPCTLLFFW
jgi:hypothetical protein